MQPTLDPALGAAPLAAGDTGTSAVSGNNGLSGVLHALRAGAATPLLALALLTLGSLWTLTQQVWRHEEQSHGPVILAVAAWLLWQHRARLAALPPVAWRSTAGVTALALLGLGWVAWVVGRSQAVLQLEALGPWLIGVGLLLQRCGLPGLRIAALPLLALLLVVPLPGLWVQVITLPMKIGVSHVAEWMLHTAGYPVARNGVVLAVDQYRLLVADACAGLASMFTLEAMGLLYMQLRGAVPRWRDVLLGLLLVPIALTANLVRVVVLVLVTFHFGDAAGRGFLHGAAGVVLFGVAMVLMLAVDGLLARRWPQTPGARR